MRTTVIGATTLAGEVNQLDAIDGPKSAEFEVAPGLEYPPAAAA
jgi:hypothetical protein